MKKQTYCSTIARHATKWSLGETFTKKELHDSDDFSGKGKYISINSDEHFALAMVVWQLSDDAEIGADSKHCQENARRIIACVNACAGIATEDLTPNSVVLLNSVSR